MPHQPPDPPTPDLTGGPITSQVPPDPPCGSRLTLSGAPHGDGTHTCDRPAGHLGGHVDSRSSTTWPDAAQRSIYQPSGYVPPPASPNPLADDIRSIATSCTDGATHGRLHDLADQVERYAAAEPDEHTLDAAGLDPEQEIRARALDVAAYTIGDVSGTVAGVAAHLIDLAEPLVDWIRTGARPDELPACACRPDPEQPNTWDGTECPRHNPAVRERRRP